MSESAITIYEWQGIYGFLPYIPWIASLRQLPKDDEAKIASEWIYGFKSKGKNANEVERMFKALADKLQCNKIVAIPPSLVKSQPNALQKIYGNHIWRIEDAETRKWNHEKEIPEGYENSFILSGIGKDDKILLVDDICTSGKTLKYYLKIIQEKGITAASACIGFHNKLKFKKVSEIAPVKLQTGETDKKQTETPTEFKNVTELAEYLNGQGWKIKPSTLYTHRKKGLIKPDIDKRGFSLKAALKYASNNLTRADTLQKKEDEDLGRSKTKAEIARIEEVTLREKTKRLKEQGDLIEKGQVYMQFAALLVRLENSAKGQAMVDAEEAVVMIGDAENKPARFVEIFNDIMDRALNEVSKMSNIQMVFGEEV